MEILEVLKLDPDENIQCDFCPELATCCAVMTAIFLCTACLEALTATLYNVDQAANAENN